MTKVSKKFEFEAIKLQVVIYGERKEMSFQEIEALVMSMGKPTRYDMGDKLGAFSVSHGVADFAQKFATVFYPDYKERVFKVNIDRWGATFWEVPVMTKQKMFNLTAPAL